MPKRLPPKQLAAVIKEACLHFATWPMTVAFPFSTTPCVGRDPTSFWIVNGAVQTAVKPGKGRWMSNSEFLASTMILWEEVQLYGAPRFNLPTATWLLLLMLCLLGIPSSA